jgi:DNA adenine methylase
MTPLRYPGGKAILAPYFQQVVHANGIRHGHYVEPYCGGAGAAISLLCAESVEEVHLNDIDKSVYAFWWTALNASDDLCEQIETTRLSVSEWERQRDVYMSTRRVALAKRGFAFFYMNRVNRSGILNAGLIGGRAQQGEWLMDARFNREELIGRIQRIARLKERISLHNEDALDFLKHKVKTLPKDALLYLDPPYFRKGQCLYRNSYEAHDHATIAKFLERIRKRYWVVSYDAVPEIRKLYRSYRQLEYGIQYSARSKYAGQEIMIFSDSLRLPTVRDPLAAGRPGRTARKTRVRWIAPKE